MAAAYDKNAPQRLLTRLGEISKDQEQGIKALGTYFSTHPPISERIDQVRRAMAQ